MLNMRISKFVIASLIFLTTFGCCDDDTLQEVPCEMKTTYVGDYTLLHESIESIQYNNHDFVFFRDSIGNELEFKLTSFPLIDTETQQITNYIVDSRCDKEFYEYSSQVRFNYLTNEAFNIRFKCMLELRLIPENRSIADVYTVLMNFPDVQDAFAHVFDGIVNQRTWSEGFNNQKFDSLEIFGTTFKNVETSVFKHPLTTVFYNAEFGIVSFTDHENRKWIFDRYE